MELLMFFVRFIKNQKTKMHQKLDLQNRTNTTESKVTDSWLGF